jgi:hypothetical protein
MAIAKHPIPQALVHQDIPREGRSSTAGALPNGKEVPPVGQAGSDTPSEPSTSGCTPVFCIEQVRQADAQIHSQCQRARILDHPLWRARSLVAAMPFFVELASDLVKVSAGFHDVSSSDKHLHR